ncbi:DoxX-like family protein [Leptospira yanagawae serovar Saopaulo str. Sao Paulo = ATCC 700523]|uniref:DoxX-like family protein n=1 Tax=Leptospira yanagawae serovar Saopaulo str. Sao Paulo = ATCC 700523 TaxID=1249483 RepID=A0A5E8HDH0_9LEPT|nr:DoxX family protein [Leptospira yanagawae]EOQ88932.1 DoxX-like family protein [Leptospira yanagawae serovar Saopaulo str. Sao Paulo = ATCC 700523]
MNVKTIFYWVTTVAISALMAFSAVSYFTNSEVVDGFKHLGFPDYFRVELGIAKVLGAIVLLLPKIPSQIKEWAYAGFGITFISAAVAHSQSGDPISMVIAPFVVFGILVTSYVLYHKTKV